MIYECILFNHDLTEIVMETSKGGQTDGIIKINIDIEILINTVNNIFSFLKKGYSFYIKLQSLD